MVFCVVDLGLEVILVEFCNILGGVCLNVGCIFLKVFLYVVKVIDDVVEMLFYGVIFGKFEIDLDKICDWKEFVIG